MIYQNPVYIFDARRSPIGRFGGSLREISASQLAIHTGRALLPPGAAEDAGAVVLGQVLQAGCGMNTARQVALGLGLPKRSTAWTVNMVCGSGLKAVAEAAELIHSGGAALVIAGGVENMSRAPHLDMATRWGARYGDTTSLDLIAKDGLTDPCLEIPMGATAEIIAGKFGISREEQDRFALRSHQLAIASRPAFAREIVPIPLENAVFSQDEHPRADSTLEKLASLRPAFHPGGTVTAGNSSGINDGAALLLLGSREMAAKHGLTPRARVTAACAVGCEPELMGLGPVHAIRSLAGETGWDPAEVPAIEINEAFAAQVLACARELGLDEQRLNPRGGGIALGHPIGCSGARILVTLLHAMEDMGLPCGIAALCVGGGMGIAMAIERRL